MALKRFLPVLAIFFSNIVLHAQKDEGLSLNGGSLDNQFEYVLSESNNYQDYEVVKEHWLSKLRRHVNDSIDAYKLEIQQNKAQLAQELNELKELQSELAVTSDTLAQVRKAQNSISLMGILVQKSSYQVIMWSLVGILLILLVFFIYRFKNSHSVTSQARIDLDQIKDEFDDYRKKAMEYQQQLRRQLQDEINKQRGVK